MSWLNMDVKCMPEFLTLSEEGTALYGDVCSGFPEPGLEVRKQAPAGRA